MSKTREHGIENPTRRKFFKAAAVSGVAVGATVAGLGKTATAKPDGGTDQKAGRYRLTAHVKQAYATARF